ncbi:MAG TPA: SAM-dependent chlorinase/fluorinase, partial [Rhodanobacteraceae bacterium]|nr:SAM-dependent chlorinase/fluorinase [Rhodanobacteraceae bacterium]
MTRTPVALLTDYGASGPYAGVLRAVILSINPDAAVCDITHQIAPQGVEEGAFVLAEALPYLPRGAVCVAVVDPGVGTARRAIALQTERLT